VQILAYQPDSSYLIGDEKTAVVFDSKTKEIVPVLNVDSLFARGYWQDPSVVSKADKAAVMLLYRKHAK
jgi:hypothetical protein